MLHEHRNATEKLFGNESLGTLMIFPEEQAQPSGARSEPTPQEMDMLVALFKQGRYAEAEALAREITAHFPLHGFGWKAMGTSLLQQGRTEEALVSLQKAAELSRGDAQLHNNLGSTLVKLERLPEAEASYLKALELNPGFVEAHHNLGNTLMQLGKLPEAEACYRRALELKPDFAEAHNNLGIVLFRLGRLDDAAASYRRTLELRPDSAEAHYNLGDGLRRAGQLDSAVASYRRALEIKPDYAEAHNNLGKALRDLGKLGDAAASYQRALEIKPDFSDANSSLAYLLSMQGKDMEALSYYRKALEASPGMVNAQNGICNVLSHMVPPWHVPMMNEQKRNNAYFSALQSAIASDSEVFEIGTGSGLLAMMAAKLGARKVTTCEAEPLIAEAAQRIVVNNGYEKVVKVISRRSTEIKVGEDLPGKADILVSEIFSSDLLGEYVLSSIEDAKRRLLKPGGRVIPAAGSIMIALFSGSDIKKNLIVEDSFGFNLQHFNSIVPRKCPIFRQDLNIEMLTEDIEALRFDFESDLLVSSQTKSLRVPIKSPGRCYGIIQWIRLQMDKNIVFENHPSEKSPVSNWQHCAYIFPEPVDVKPGQVAVISASHNRVVPWFILDGIESV